MVGVNVGITHCLTAMTRTTQEGNVRWVTFAVSVKQVHSGGPAREGGHGQ